MIFNIIQKLTGWEASSTYKRVIGNTGWLMFDRILRMTVGIYIAVWVARYLGPDQFGLLNYALALTAILSLLSTLGLEQIILRDLAKDPNKANVTLGTAAVLRLSGALFSLLFSVLIVYLLRPGEYLTLMIVGIIAFSVFFQSSDIIDLFFKAQVNSKYPVVAKSIAFIIVSLFKIVLIISNASLVTFAVASLAEIVLGALGLFIAYRIEGNNIAEWKFSIERAKELLNESWPLLLSGIAILVYMRIDQLMLGQMIGDTSVGFYSAALKLSEVWYAVPVAIMNSATPLLTQTFSNDLKQYHFRLQKLFNLMTLMGLVLALPTTFLAPYIIKIIYGEEFIASASILSIHIWSFVFVGWGLLKDMILVTQSMAKIILLTTITGALCNVILNYFLIPAYQGNGAAMATLISQLISVSIVLLFVKQTKIFVGMQIKSLFKFYDVIPK